MIIVFIVLFSLLAAGVGALAARAVFRAVRWIWRIVRFLLGVTLLAATVMYYYPRLFGIKKE